MKKALITALGVCICLVGIALGIYLGIWVFLVGGIVSIVTGATATPVIASMIAWGVVKFLLAGVVGWGSFWLTFLVGAGLVSAAQEM